MERLLTEHFAKFISKTRYHDLRKEVIHQAKRCLLDFLGVALGGSSVFKMHAACRHIHATLDVTMEIMNRNKIDIREIKGIEVQTYSIAYALTGQKKEAETEFAAKFSIPVSVALALVYGKVGPDEYSGEHIRNPLVRELAEKVVVVVDEARDKDYPKKRGSGVKIATAKRVYTHDLDMAKGDPESPFSDQELKDKFSHNANKVLSSDKIEKIQEVIFQIEDRSIWQLTDLLS